MSQSADVPAAGQLHAPRDVSNPVEQIKPRFVFLLFLFIYMLTWGGHYTSGDGAAKIAWAKAILERGSSDIDPGPGVAVSRFGVGHTLLAIPPLAVSMWLKNTTGIGTESVTYTFLFVLNGALFLWLVAHYLRPHYSARRVWAMVLLIGLATSWWPYTKLDFSEPLVVTFWFAGFLCLRRGKTILAAFLAGFAMTIRPEAFILTALLFAWHFWRSRSRADLWRILLGLAPSLLIIAAANYIRFGSMFNGGYSDDPFDNPLLEGVYGLLLSPGRGAFLFSPPLLIGCLAWKRFRAAPHARDDAVLFLGVFVAQTLFYAKWWAWSGDDSWGARFLLPSMALMSIPAIELLHRKALVSVVAATGIFVQLLGSLISGLDYIILLRKEPAMKIQYYGWTGGDSLQRIGMDDIRYHPRYSQISGHILLVRVLLGIPPKAEEGDAPGRIGRSLYDSLPPETWRRHAHWDFIWLRAFRPASGSPNQERALN